MDTGSGDRNSPRIQFRIVPMSKAGNILVAAGLAALAGCVQMPTAPAVRVMPAPYKPFDLFVADDTFCRQFAQGQIGQSTEQAQGEVVGSAVTGAAVGAAAGGLIGDSSRAAGTGAGVGLILGSLAGAGASERSSWDLQRRYDWAYQQCMYAKGNQVPGFAPIRVPPPPPPPAPPSSR
jgi:hypothetical protein